MTPTGYTYPITHEKNFTFKDFALNCAKAFIGRMIEYNGPIPEKFEIYPYHLTKLHEIQAEYNSFLALTDEEKNNLWKKETAELFELHDEMNKDTTEEKHKYEAMLLQVTQWTPPTQKHECLKTFMIQQIKGSIEYDIRFFDNTLPINYITWLENKHAGYEHQIHYHKKEYEKDVTQTKELNEWIQKLRDSL